MRKLSIFDGSERIATVSIIGQNAFIFARSPREWNDVKRWIDRGFYRLDKKTDDYLKVDLQDANFLDLLAERAQEYDFNTELLDE